MENNKIKIAYLIGSSEIGGTEKMILTLVKYLDKKYFDPIFFCIKGNGKFTEKLKFMGWKTYILNLKRNPFDFLKLFLLLRKEDPHILHCFLFVANILGRIYGKLLRINFIISSQRSTDPWRKWYHWLIEKITVRWVDTIISNSFKAKEILVKKGIPENKIIVIPNGIEIPTVKEKKEKKDKIIIGTIGNLKRAKGHFYLIEVGKIIVQFYRNVLFYIIGEGELKKEIIKKIEEENLKDFFILTGYVENINDYLEKFDIFILSSLWEGCPVSLLESMSYGIPPISFDVGDVSYIIDDGVNGFIIKKGDYRKMAEKVIILIQDEKLRKKMGENARKKILEKFSFETMVKNFSSIYLKAFEKSL